MTTNEEGQVVNLRVPPEVTLEVFQTRVQQYPELKPHWDAIMWEAAARHLVSQQGGEAQGDVKESDDDVGPA